jgi:hypothetical protein
MALRRGLGSLADVLALCEQEPDDQLAQGARGVREREARRNGADA